VGGGGSGDREWVGGWATRGSVGGCSNPGMGARVHFLVRVVFGPPPSPPVPGPRCLTQMSISPAGTYDLVFTKAAFRSGLQAPGWPDANSSNAEGQAVVKAVPKSKTLLLGFDVSCQQANFDLRVPNASLSGNAYLHSLNGADVALLGTGDQVAVDVDFTALSVSSVPRLNRLVAATLSGAHLGPHGCTPFWGHGVVVA
jgi:hypothetical protein